MRFQLAPDQRIALLFGLVPLASELPGLVGQARLLVGGVRHPRTAGDDDFLVLMVLGIERGDRGGRASDGAVERRGFVPEAAQRLLVGRDQLPQLLDLTPGLENAARPDASAAGHQARTAKHVAVDRDNGQRGETAAARRGIVGRRDPSVVDRLSNRAGERPVHANDRGERNEIVR